MRFQRALQLVKLGFWAGMLASAHTFERAFPSRRDAEDKYVSPVAGARRADSA